MFFLAPLIASIGAGAAGTAAAGTAAAGTGGALAGAGTAAAGTAATGAEIASSLAGAGEAGASDILGALSTVSEPSTAAPTLNVGSESSIQLSSSISDNPKVDISKTPKQQSTPGEVSDVLNGKSPKENMKKPPDESNKTSRKKKRRSGVMDSIQVNTEPLGLSSLGKSMV